MNSVLVVLEAEKWVQKDREKSKTLKTWSELFFKKEKKVKKTEFASKKAKIKREKRNFKKEKNQCQQSNCFVLIILFGFFFF